MKKNIKPLTEEELKTRFAYRRIMIIANKIKTLMRLLPAPSRFCSYNRFWDSPILSHVNLILENFKYGLLDIKEINTSMTNAIYVDLKLNKAEYFVSHSVTGYKFEANPVNSSSLNSMKEELNKLEEDICKYIKLEEDYIDKVNKSSIINSVIGE